MTLRRVVSVLVAMALIGAGLAWAYHDGWIWFVRPSPTEFPVRGVDVSHHQGEIDWQAVARDNVKFAWIKATEGEDWTDPDFERNRQGAAAAGIPWGAYHFFTFCGDPTKQAAHLIAVVGDDRGGLPPAIDVETGGNCSKRLPPAKLRAMLDVFLAAIEPVFGREAVLYVTHDQVDALFGVEGPPDRPIWLRDVQQQPLGRQWIVWQYHPRGWVSGIGTFADLNVFAGDERAFREWIHGGALGDGGE